jgi:signal transduction histidine kinase
MLSAAYAGAGPGLLATLLSSLAIAWFDLGTTHTLDLGVDDLVRLAAFTLTAFIISAISAARKAAERDLRAALEELSALDRSKDEFIATVSHELRTPLTGIIGWLRILRVKDLDAETRALALDSIEQSASTQAMLVSDLLDASRIVLGKLYVDRQPLFVQEVVDEAMAVIRPSAEAKKIRLHAHEPDRSMVISGDRERLKQVVWNLLSNAVKFTPESGSIRVRTLLDGDDVVIEVADDGEGIDDALLPHIFHRFKQGDAGVRKGGLGLGLSIARHIVELHDGSISARSAGGNRGSTFTVRLPVVREPERQSLSVHPVEPDRSIRRRPAAQ